nr:hypothetical protein [uncultured Shimia sp.]
MTLEGIKAAVDAGDRVHFAVWVELSISAGSCGGFFRSLIFPSSRDENPLTSAANLIDFGTLGRSSPFLSEAAH